MISGKKVGEAVVAVVVVLVAGGRKEGLGTWV